MIRRAILLSSALLLAPLAAASAGGDEPARAAALTRALEAVRAPNLSADLHFIASDELGGRDTPSEGLRVAARFIRSRLQRLGWEPGCEDGYFHTYWLESRQLDGEATFLEIARGDQARRLVFGRDYFFWARRVEDATTRGEVVFAGTGDELDGLELRGRWALCLDEGGSTRRLARNVEATGAVGLIVVPGPGYDGEAYAERYGRAAERVLRPSVTFPRPDRRRGGEEQAEQRPFSTVYVTTEAAEGLVPEGAEAGQRLDVVVTDVRKRKGGDEGRVPVENVAGFWPGSDPELANEVIILSAHYDHVGTSSDGEVYNGADDNGSGTCGLLAVAEALAEYGPMRRSVLLLWVSGEEKGLWGSQAWTSDPWLPEGCRAVCDINIDMIGRNDPEQLLLTPSAEHEAYSGLSRMVQRLAPEEGFTDLGSADQYWRRSDHMNFNMNMGIPVAFLFTDVHEDYHRTTDTADRVDYDKMRRVVRLVVRLLDGLQADALDL
jgi:hypothetical protein